MVNTPRQKAYAMGGKRHSHDHEGIGVQQSSVGALIGIFAPRAGPVPVVADARPRVAAAPPRGADGPHGPPHELLVHRRRRLLTETPPPS